MAYTVRPGDSLSQILRDQGNPNWNQPSEWAKVGLSNPNVIYPGQQLNLPAFNSGRNFSPANFSPVPSTSFQPNPQSYRPGSAVSSPGFVNGTPDWVKPLVQKASEKYNVPSVMLSALLKQESGFNPEAVSPVGASGIAQFMPETAKAFGINPWDPAQAIEAAAKYIRTEWDHFGKPELALAAYNAGRGAVERYGGIPPYKETQGYVKNIMAMSGDVHRTAYQPTLDTQNEVKKQQEKAPQVQTDKSFSSPTSMSSRTPAMSRPQMLSQQLSTSSPMYNDQGQRYMPGFWQGDWGDRTAQGVEQRSAQIMNQTPPLNVKINIPEYMRRFIINPQAPEFDEIGVGPGINT